MSLSKLKPARGTKFFQTRILDFAGIYIEGFMGSQEEGVNSNAK